MTDLQKTAGYIFNDETLLKTALTHSSYSNEKGLIYNNERLEFLGDSLLGFITAEYLYKNFGKEREGDLTKLRALLVCENSLFEFANILSLGEYLILGKGEEQTGGRKRPSILADAFEALIAAVYLDGGIDAVRPFVLRFIKPAVMGINETDDYKTILQEKIQKVKGSTIRYELTGETGPDHDKVFSMVVIINGKPGGEGRGKSKKEAEQQAAKSALSQL